MLNVSPGKIKGTSFYNGKTDISLTANLSNEILARMESKEDLYIPEYEEIYKEVLIRYNEDFRKEGVHSYDYKLKSERIK